MTDRPSPISGTVPPTHTRFGQPGANPSGDQQAAANAKHLKNKLLAALAANPDELAKLLDDPRTPAIVRKLTAPLKPSEFAALEALTQPSTGELRYMLDLYREAMK
ncbi:hypothetical protein [Bifidobacterium pullorum]|uniref:hypothetical protein n=1 Tax=Bifidobacterium pullorum TaxID=78448 RepID=UPI0032086177